MPLSADPAALLQVVQMVSQCGDSTNLDVQLTVIKTLLTVTTAEHFRVHGDCLVQVAPLFMQFESRALPACLFA